MDAVNFRSTFYSPWGILCRQRGFDGESQVYVLNVHGSMVLYVSSLAWWLSRYMSIALRAGWVTRPTEHLPNAHFTTGSQLGPGYVSVPALLSL